LHTDVGLNVHFYVLKLCTTENESDPYLQNYLTVLYW